MKFQAYIVWDLDIVDLGRRGALSQAANRLGHNMRSLSTKFTLHHTIPAHRVKGLEGLCRPRTEAACDRFVHTFSGRGEHGGRRGNVRGKS